MTTPLQSGGGRILVAHHILRALGGDLQLVHGADANGCLGNTRGRVTDSMANGG
jgi:hypothetical protein